jgi:hypothetical protein
MKEPLRGAGIVWDAVVHYLFGWGQGNVLTKQTGTEFLESPKVSKSLQFEMLVYGVDRISPS